jgi:hypothetical protein
MVKSKSLEYFMIMVIKLEAGSNANFSKPKCSGNGSEFAHPLIQPLFSLHTDLFLVEHIMHSR